jgi:hypothetical protein
MQDIGPAEPGTSAGRRRRLRRGSAWRGGGGCQPDSWEARSTTWWYSIMIRAGEMLKGKDWTRPVARSTTQNDPPPALDR